MRKTLPCFVAALALASMVARARGAEGDKDWGYTPRHDKDGYEILFDGKDLDAWDFDGNRNGWVITAEGELHRAAAAGDIWSKRRYCDFVLDLEFKVAKGTNSGVFLRTHSRRNWLHTGMEVQVLDSAGKDRPGRHDAGALYDVQAPVKNAMKPAGEWNRCVITADENTLTVVLNGEKVNEVDLDRWTEPRRNPDGSRNKFNYAYKDMIREGFLAFQDHGDPVWYRKVRIRILGERKPMFTGKERYEDVKERELASRPERIQRRREFEERLRREKERAKAPARPKRPAASPKKRAAAAAEKLFKMGRQAERMGQRGAAITFYEKVVKDHPDTPAAGRAAAKLEKLRP